MKRFIILIMAVTGFLIYSELNISLKESGYIANYGYPFYISKIEPVLASLAARLNLSILEDDLSLRGRETARVTRVIDGDTIDVFLNGEVRRIRYVGINTPERDEPCFKESTRANSRLVRGARVALVRDESDSDQYGRLLRYVYVGDVLVERELVTQGFAESVLYANDDKHFREFRSLEKEAAKAGLGCHPTGIFDDNNSRR
ncbi:MAG: thermonuclease family protein [Gammaproteobacteria bacterium]|nr:thermonuclease family protein [Gammaproteobacteria bacterium]